MTAPPSGAGGGRLSARQIVRSMYWAVRKDPSAWRHVLSVFARLPGKYLRLRRLLGGRAVTFIVRTDHIGDLVAAEPIARRVARDDPGRQVVWVVNQRYAALVAVFSPACIVFPVGCMTDWIWLRRLVSVPSVLNLHIDGHSCPLCRVPLPGNLDAGITFENYLDGNNLTEMQYLLAGYPKINDMPLLAPQPAERRKVRDLGLPPVYIVIHCKANDQERDWSASGWAGLVERIVAEYDATVVEIGLEPVAIRSPGPRRISLCGKLSILETAEVLRAATLFIGIDSGPAHLANAGRDTGGHPVGLVPWLQGPHAVQRRLRERRDGRDRARRRPGVGHRRGRSDGGRPAPDAAEPVPI